MKKIIEAARHAKGMIRLDTDSAENVTRAIESVTTITAKEGAQVEFEGTRIIEGHGFALQVNCFDIYECANGYLLHTYMDTGPNWAVTGKSLKELLSRAPDQRVARRAHGLLIQKNLIAFGH
jgi:predicted small metal-binding protein